MSVAAHVCLLILGIHAVYSANDDTTPKLRFYYSGVEHFTELPLAEAANIFAYTWYNSSRTTVFIAHGFTGKPNGTTMTTMVTAYLQRGDSNVVLLNWAGMAAVVTSNFGNSYFNWAVPNARKLGVYVADTLYKLSNVGLDLANTHLIGHSLGAHVFGIAGNNLLEKGILLPWITGLDPANAAFESKPVFSRLNPGSAAVVVAIHSDPSKYGFKRSIGTVDFWPNYRNGRVLQPGCPDKSSPRFSPEDLCNHDRSWQLLLDAIKRPGSLMGSFAKNYRMWKNYSKEDRNAITLDLGTFGKRVLAGNYYFVTSSSEPYGLGTAGL
ncbi:phospholipase A1-like [Choristoneura fumiferana]|uniref:phospholipase A1-like n=1 Tax=Choristoneura fumiferana TaxID=7141 RepID=UPI003D158303